MIKAVIHTDGACSGNPGHSGVGAVIKIGAEVHNVSEYIGMATNNIAEYKALLRGLEKARALGATSVEVFMDSELVVKQLKGQYRVKNENLAVYFAEIVKLKDAFKSFKIAHIPREENSEADALARKAVKSHTKK